MEGMVAGRILGIFHHDPLLIQWNGGSQVRKPEACCRISVRPEAAASSLAAASKALLRNRSSAFGQDGVEGYWFCALGPFAPEFCAFVYRLHGSEGHGQFAFVALGGPVALVFVQIGAVDDHAGVAGTGTEVHHEGFPSVGAIVQGAATLDEFDFIGHGGQNTIREEDNALTTQDLIQPIGQRS